MTLYVTEISKYIIAVLAAVFAFLGFWVLRYRSEKKRMPYYLTQTGIIFLIEGLCFTQIVIRTGQINYLIYCLAVTGILAAMLLLFKSIFPGCNRLILNHMAFLLMTSFLILIRISESKAMRQMIIASISIFMMFIVCELIYRYPFFSRIAWVYAFSGLLMLLIVRVLGSLTNGSYLSITMLGVTFQPSEFVKPVLIFFLGCILCNSASAVNIVFSFAVTSVYMVVLLASRDLGASSILFVITLFVVFIATGKIRYMIGGFALGAAGSILAYVFFAHVRVRVTSWLDPWTTIDTGGYQLTQSLFGISSGGFWGLGLFKGDPSLIPFVEDDFIFSAIAEEFGIIYAVSLIAVSTGIFLMILYEASRLRDRWSRLIDAGIAVSFIFQTFLTVGGGTRFIPLTGVTLPLVSYGGSSMMSTVIMMGVFEATALIREDEHYEAVEYYSQSRGYSSQASEQ
jgi:cell division protein FtsW (lipid II flippase)